MPSKINLFIEMVGVVFYALTTSYKASLTNNFSKRQHIRKNNLRQSANLLTALSSI